MEAEVSDDRAQPFAIDVRVTRGCCDTLMTKESLGRTQERDIYARLESVRTLCRSITVVS